MGMWEIISLFLFGVFFIDMALLLLLLRQEKKIEEEREKERWNMVDSLFEAWRRTDKMRLSAIGEARRVNRAAKVRKWVRRMGLKESTAFLAESVLLRQRFEKILEELSEFDSAIIKGDRIAIADAVADLQVVLETIPILLGYDGEAAFNAVHASNMTKDPDLFRKDGKGKGKGFLEPELDKIPGLIG